MKKVLVLYAAIALAPVARAQEHKVTGFDVPLIPAWGGSGVVSPTAHGILVAEGSSAFNPIVLASGQILLGSSSADPSAVALNLGEVVSLGNQVNSVTAGGQVTWGASGHTYSVAAPQIQFSTDSIAYIVAGSNGASVAGEDLYIYAGGGNGGSASAHGSNLQLFGQGLAGDSGGCLLDGGVSAGTSIGGGTLTLRAARGTGAGFPGQIQIELSGRTLAGGSVQGNGPVVTWQGNFGNSSGNSAVETISPTWTAPGASSATARTVYINPTISQSNGAWSGGYESLVINTVESNLGGSTATNYSQRWMTGGTHEVDLTSLGSLVMNATGSQLAQSSTDHFFYVPQVATGAPSGTPTAFTGNVAMAAGPAHLYAYLSGSWLQIDGGGSESLGQAVSVGNQVNSVTASGQITWGASGSYSTSTPEEVGPSNQVFYVLGGSQGSGLAGQTIHVGGGFGNGVGGPAGGGYFEGIGQAATGYAGGWKLYGGDSNGNTAIGGDCNIDGSTGTGSGTPSSIFIGVAGINASSSTAVQVIHNVCQITGSYNNTSGSTPLWTINPTWADGGGSSSSTNAITMRLSATYNYTALSPSGSTTDLLINRIESALPTGTNRFLDLQANTISKAFITNAGAMTLAGNLTLNGSSSGSTTFSAGASPTATTYTWPSSPTNGSFLQTNSSGTLSWAIPNLPQFAVHATLTSGPNNLDSTAIVWPNDTTSGAFTDTLPDATTCSGRIYVIKIKASTGNALTLNTTSSQTIDGQTSITFTTQYQSVFIYSDGANWWIIA